MKYKFEDLRQVVSAKRVAEEYLNIPLNANGRMQAIWRGGDGYNVAFTPDGRFYDHVEKKGGDAVELLCLIKGITKEQAVEALGDMYCPNLALYRTPEPPRKNITIEKPTEEFRRQENKFDAAHANARKVPDQSPGLIIPPERHEAVRNDDYEPVQPGYTAEQSWDYVTREGNYRKTVIRYTYPDGHKDYRQRTSTGWSSKQEGAMLYRWNKIADADEIFIVEGEKCADSLVAHGFEATTVDGGCGKWKDFFSKEFIGKKVVIIGDNDSKGQEHARDIWRSVSPYARQVKIIDPAIGFRMKKGDIADWFDNGHTSNDMRVILMKLPLAPRYRIEFPDEEQRALAKKWNGDNIFRNYNRKRIPDVLRPGTYVDQILPRTLQEMAEELRMRLCGFPYRLGDLPCLFDFDFDRHEIRIIKDDIALIAWVQEKIRGFMEFARGNTMVSSKVFFQYLLESSRRFDSFSSTPRYYYNPNVFCTYQHIPAPTPGHVALENLLMFFRTAGGVNDILLKTFFASPLYGVGQPLWVIDTKDGRGVGKTTLVVKLAKLYGQTVLTVGHQIEEKPEEVTKRIISREGRKKNIALIDNVVGDFHSPQLAEWVTMPTISGRPAYGEGESTRPNDITWVITSNSAQMDGDISNRTYQLYLKKPDIFNRSDWEQKVDDYIERYRFEIFADLIDILRKHEERWQIWKDQIGPDFLPRTRVFNFETKFLWAFCPTQHDANRVSQILTERQEEANTDQERANILWDVIRENLLDINMDPEADVVWIPTMILKRWLQESHLAASLANDVRDFAKNKYIRNIHPTLSLFPHYTKDKDLVQLRRRGCMWIPSVYLQTWTKPDEMFTVKLLKEVGKRVMNVRNVVYCPAQKENPDDMRQTPVATLPPDSI